jgi:hypothetical protein
MACSSAISGFMDLAGMVITPGVAGVAGTSPGYTIPAIAWVFRTGITSPARVSATATPVRPSTAMAIAKRMRIEV